MFPPVEASNLKHSVRAEEAAACAVIGKYLAHFLLQKKKLMRWTIFKMKSIVLCKSYINVKNMGFQSTVSDATILSGAWYECAIINLRLWQERVAAFSLCHCLWLGVFGPA